LGCLRAVLRASTTPKPVCERWRADCVKLRFRDRVCDDPDEGVAEPRELSEIEIG
jgi:hypothetical protein